MTSPAPMMAPPVPQGLILYYSSPVQRLSLHSDMVENIYKHIIIIITICNLNQILCSIASDCSFTNI